MDDATLYAQSSPVALGSVLARAGPQPALRTQTAQLDGPDLQDTLSRWSQPKAPIIPGRGSVVLNIAKSCAPVEHFPSRGSPIYPIPQSLLLMVGILSVQHRNVGYLMPIRNAT